MSKRDKKREKLKKWNHQNMAFLDSKDSPRGGFHGKPRKAERHNDKQKLKRDYGF